MRVLDRGKSVSDRAHTRLNCCVPCPESQKGILKDKTHTRTQDMPEGSPGTGFDIRRLFSPGTQAREGREDPRTEPHVPVHAAPENPTPITLEDMSDQGGVGSPRRRRR